MQPKVDHNGWKYFDELPAGYRVASLDDFHTEGKRKIGMEFLIRWVSRNYYQVCVVTDRLSAAWLNEFVIGNRVYVKEQP